MPMQMLRKRIENLANYLLLNGFSLSSSGLYQGRAGVALALFEAARTLGSDYMETQAVDLLEQVLLSKTENTNFRSGLAGTGYALATLLRWRYVDADFGDLFAPQTEKIQAACAKGRRPGAATSKRDNTMDNMDVCLFFAAQPLADMRPRIFGLLKQAENSLARRFKAVGGCRDGNVQKSGLLADWSHYLRVVAACAPYKVSETLLHHYTRLYQRGFFCRHYEVGTRLAVLVVQRPDAVLQAVAEDNIVQADFWDYATLREAVDTCALQLSVQPDAAQTTIRQHFVNTDEPAFETWLSLAAPDRVAKVGYGGGVARLVLLLCYAAAQAKGEDTARFVHLFN